MGFRKICFRISNGVYGCKWNREERSASHTVLREKLWWWFVFLVFLLTVSALFCWSVFSNDYSNFEWFIYDKSGVIFSFGTLILAVFTIVVFYLLLLCLTGFSVETQARRLHICHKISLFFVLLLPILGYTLVHLLWKEEYGAVLIAWRVLGPFLHIAILVSFIASSFFIFREMMKLQNKNLIIITSVIYWCIMVFICLLPLSIDSPCIRPNLDRISKPILIGHRGVNTRRAPENTLLSFTAKNTICDVFGVESDVRLSLDGIPFLMHDRTLLRTTNVRNVFPDRMNDRPESFYWYELQTLDAGSWFLEQDPYQTVRFLSVQEKEAIKQQKVPSLRDLASITKGNNHSLMFDLFRPPKNHPNYHNFWNVTLQTLLDSGLSQRLVLWLPGMYRDTVHTTAPGFRLVSPLRPIKELLESKIEFVNVEYLSQSVSTVENYKQNNLSVIQYTISTPWLFSAAWCQGANIVTTNDCRSLTAMTKPIYTLSPSEYLAIWLCCDLLCLAVSAFLLLHHYRHVYLKRSRSNNISNEPKNVGHINQSYM